MRKTDTYKTFGLIVALAFIYSNITKAQGPPIYTDTPILLGLDGGGIRTFGKFTSTGTGNSFVQPFIIPYNLTTDFQIGIVQPFVILFPKGQDSKSGFGNLTLFGKYSIFQKNGKGKTFRGLLKYKQSFNTGSGKVSPDTVISQFDFVTGYITTQYGIYCSIGYAFISQSMNDKLFFNFSFAYPLLPQKYPPFQLNLFLELNCSHMLEINKNLIFVSPGMQLITTSTFLIEAGFQIPVVDDLNLTDYSTSLGIRYLVF